MEGSKTYERSTYVILKELILLGFIAPISTNLDILTTYFVRSVFCLKILELGFTRLGYASVSVFAKKQSSLQEPPGGKKKCSVANA